MQGACERRSVEVTRSVAIEPVERQDVAEVQIVNVWLIQEDESFCDLLKQALLCTDDIVCHFAGSELDLEQVTHTAQPDVVLLDVQFRRRNALELLHRVKALLPNSPVVVLADSAEPHVVSSALLAGASGYLLKNSPLPKIIEAVREVHAGGAAMSPQVTRSMLEMLRRLSPSPSTSRFTPRERKIIELMTRGLLMKEIAHELALSYHTVDSHLRNIYSKLDVHTRTSAVAKILQERLG